MKKYTSIHSLNGDMLLNKFNFKLYFLFNKINNLFPNLYVDKKILQKNFEIKKLKEIWKVAASKASPSRKLSDFFWHELPWKDIRKVLGEINILDIGSGSGRYAENFMRFSNNIIKSYLGIDISDEPETKDVSKKYKNVKFKTFDGLHISPFLNDVNMITSQSAFEHIPEDLNFFRQIADYVKTTDRPIIQVHLLPSAAGLKLYRKHGIRQYTPRNISKITRLFDKNSNIILYSLGGQNSIEAHYKYITKPLIIDKNTDLRETNEIAYNEDVYNAIIKDKETINNPAFYALIIESNFNSKLFN